MELVPQPSVCKLLQWPLRKLINNSLEYGRFACRMRSLIEKLLRGTHWKLLVLSLWGKSLCLEEKFDIEKRTRIVNNTRLGILGSSGSNVYFPFSKEKFKNFKQKKQLWLRGMHVVIGQMDCTAYVESADRIRILEYSMFTLPLPSPPPPPYAVSSRT